MYVDSILLCRQCCLLGADQCEEFLPDDDMTNSDFRYPWLDPNRSVVPCDETLTVGHMFRACQKESLDHLNLRCVPYLIVLTPVFDHASCDALVAAPGQSHQLQKSVVKPAKSVEVHMLVFEVSDAALEYRSGDATEKLYRLEVLEQKHILRFK